MRKRRSCCCVKRIPKGKKWKRRKKGTNNGEALMHTKNHDLCALVMLVVAIAVFCCRSRSRWVSSGGDRGCWFFSFSFTLPILFLIISLKNNYVFLYCDVRCSFRLKIEDFSFQKYFPLLFCSSLLLIFILLS